MAEGLGLMRSESGRSGPGQEAFSTSAPAIVLPKGGGAIRGIGEKFAANPVTGTGSMSVPIATSPGRSGFGPQLSLTYDSGAGNGPFGFGWGLSLPSITRKTDKGLPQYLDAVDSDVFILSGAEDLVPVYRQDADGTWVRDAFGRLVVHEDELDGYRVRRYRPRIEGLFARIERWSKISSPGDVHWRSISKDNILTLYGHDANSRIADPLDAGRIFSWLICESRDDKGNGIRYIYKPEDGTWQSRPGQADPFKQVYQLNRGDADDARRTAQRYLQRVLYGNVKPLLDAQGRRPRHLSDLPRPPTDTGADWLFEVRFDYGELDDGDPTGQSEKRWLYRPDAFSSYRPGFEVRTCRRCERVLMLHHIPDQPASPGRAAQPGYRGVVRSTEFTYDDETDPNLATRPVYSFLEQVVQTGWKREGGLITRRSLPPVEFEYTKPEVQDALEDVDPESLENLPIGLDGGVYRWTDLHGEGIPGILTEQAGAWYYKRNWSPVPAKLPDGSEAVKATLAPLEAVALKPNVALSSGAEFMDLAGDGQPDIVLMEGVTPGLYEHDEAEGWQPFRPFTSYLSRDLRGDNVKFVDLDGDGHADVLITEDDAFVWHASLAEEGFGPARRVAHALDEERGARIVFADGTQSIYLADMSGDGLTDLVRIRNSEICYWPNLGYCRFGAKVTMDFTDENGHAASFDHCDQFDHERIRLADIDGSGTTDIIYLHRDGVRLYFNQSGNGWSQPSTLRMFPRTGDLASILPTDLLGNGTACLVWSSPLPGDAGRPMRYVNLMGKDKPHLLVRIRNNLGATTDVFYAPSTKFYLEDKRDGKPWVTRLPFPVHVVERVSVADKWRGTTFSTTYSYHHGYFDGAEREFRGFGRVEQIDTEEYGRFSAGNAASPYITTDHKLYQPPVKTVTWFHTGAFVGQGRVPSLYANEYFPNWFEALRPQTADVLGGFQENTLPEPDFADTDLTTEEWREALRACKGMPLRQEIYELDVDALRDGAHQPVKLFSTAYHNCHIDRLQARGTNPHAVFLVTESEAITYHYELDLRPAQVRPDPRVSHTLNLRIDEYGNVLQSVAVGYPRFLPFDDTDAALNPQTVSLIRKVQSELHIAYTETRYTDELNDSDILAGNHRLPLPCEIQTFELTGITAKDASDAPPADVRDDRYFSIGELRAYRLSERHQASGKAVGTLQYHEQPDRTSNPPPAQKRLVEYVRTLYFDDASGTAAPENPLDFGRHGPRGLKYEDYKLALTDALLTAVFGARLAESIAGSSARQKLASAATCGYLSGTELADRFNPLGTAGQFWMRSGVAGFAADAAQHFFLPERYEDSFGNVTEIAFDPRDLYMQSTKDARSNEVRITDFDFRVQAPRAMQDANGNVTRAAYDVLGMPVAVALESAGDTLAGLSPGLLDPSPSEVARFMELEPYAETDPRRWLGQATSRFAYHLGGVAGADGRVTWEAQPAAACAIQRETHVAQLAGQQTKIQLSIEYSDGGGNVLVKKAQAEPDPESRQQNPPLRWIASGKTVLNNKGKPVKQYEPYFSHTEHRFDETEATNEVGVTPVMYYDAPGRLIRTEMPDATFSRVEFSPWHVKTFDANDTAFDTDPAKRSDWYNRRKDPAHPRFAEFSDAQSSRAAEQAEKHANTPARMHLDSLGREVIAIAHNRTPDPNGVWQDDFYATFTKLDTEGKPLWIRDARGNLVMQYIRPYKPTRLAGTPPDPHQPGTTAECLPDGAVPCYDIAGNLLFQHSMDAGDRWMLMDAAGKPMLAWDLNDKGPGSAVQARMFHTEYDELHRPVKQWLKIDTAAAALIEVFDYCDSAHPLLPDNRVSLADARQRNLIGQPVRHWDPSGLSTIERIDLSGEHAHVTGTLIKPDADGGTGVLNWGITNRSSLLEAETFRQITEYDALGRVKRLYKWHRDITFAASGAQQPTPGATNRVAVYEPEYGERGALVSEWLHIRATKTTGSNGRVSFSKDTQRSRQTIKQVTYNAKGQKLSTELGNGTTTRYTYDPETFRLTHLFTRRSGVIAANDCASNTAGAPRPQRPCGVQNLHYTYDPVGNITHIQDDAQDSRFFANSFVEPSNHFIYDALYRLIEGTGRENAAAVAPPRNREDPWPTGGFPSADALRNYTQRYSYDAVGNLVAMVHQAGNGNGWTRHYTTRSDSNRLDQTWYGNNTLEAVTYRHDAHGNMLNLNRTTPPPLDPEDEWGLDIRWDWRDMIMGVDLEGGGLARYHYGIDKQRTRKHITRQGGVAEDRVYLGGYELYRRYKTDGTTLVEEIESHHLFEGEQRVLLVDDLIRTGGPRNPRPDGLPVKAQTLFRYQYSNHLGSACLELDDQARIISYEEYHPYGTSAYRLLNSAVEAPPKRYRGAGMERDEESGLSYHIARLYAPWLSRWISSDPAGLADGVNLYSFVRGNPVALIDDQGRQSGPPSRPILANVDETLARERKQRRVAETNAQLDAAFKAFQPNSMGEALREGLNVGFGAPFTLMPALQFNTTPLASSRADLSLMSGHRRNLLDPANLMTPLLPSKARLLEAGYSDKQAAAIFGLAAVHDRTITAAYRMGLGVGLLGAAANYATLFPESMGAAGEVGQLGRTVLRSEGEVTGVAHLDRLAVQTPEYAPWKAALEKRGWEVIEDTLRKGTMATTEVVPNQAGTMSKIVTIDPAQATYFAMLHESKHVYQVETLARQGIAMTTPMESQMLHAAEYGAYAYETRVIRTYASQAGKLAAQTKMEPALITRYFQYLEETRNLHWSLSTEIPAPIWKQLKR
jgi:RHS repeat-associated protein